MNIQLKNKEAKIHKVYPRRCSCYCPFHESGKGTPDISIDLEGEYSGCWHCFSCLESGKISPRQLERLRGMRKHKSKPVANINWEELSNTYYHTYLNCRLEAGFQPSISSLSQIEELMVTQPWLTGWDGGAWCLPLRQADNSVCGIQRVFRNRRKCCLEGSKLGLMIPQIVFDSNKPLYITEGWGDACVALACGVQVIGRPNCNTLEDEIVVWLTLHGFSGGGVIIIADNDAPGKKGALSLQNMVGLVERKPEIKVPEVKDLRALFESNGRTATQEFLKG